MVANGKTNNATKGTISMAVIPFKTDAQTLSVPEAGRHYYDLSKNASYAAAKRGDIPTIRVGRLLRVPVVAMERRLDEAGGIPRRPEAEAFVRS